MKLQYYILLFFLCLFFSCGDDPVNDIVEPEDVYVITVSSYIERTGVTYKTPDSGADIFIYFGVYSLDLLGYNLEENGNWAKGDKTIIPHVHEKLPENGEKTIELTEADEAICIIIRSKIITQNNIANASFTNSRKKISFENIFIVN